MKTGILIALFSLLSTGFFGATLYGQQADLKSIEATILAFAKAGDQSNAAEVAQYLDDNYRVVMNRLFGSSSVSIVDKAGYLDKIRTKEWGGDNRKVRILNVIINGNTATAQTNLVGTKITFISLFTLIKNADGLWKLVQDMPIIQ